MDFAVTYYLGRKVASDPMASFCLVSKDKGYDPLIEHLRTRNVAVKRIDDFAALTPTTVAAPHTPSALRSNLPPLAAPLTARVLDHLRQNANSRPKREKTLMRQLASQFLKGAPQEDVTRLITTLVGNGYLKIDAKGALTYQLNPLP